MKSKRLLLLFSVAFFIAASLCHYMFNDRASNRIAKFQKQLHKKESQLNDEITRLKKRATIQNYNTLFAQKPDYYNSLFEKEGLVLLIYENDSLKYWSDNSVAVENWRKEVCLDTKMVKLQNGWFEVLKTFPDASSAKYIIGLILIKNEFSYQNKYLENTYQKDFGLPATVNLIPDSPAKAYAIRDINNNYLFSLQFNNAFIVNHFAIYLELLLNSIGFVLLIVFIKKSIHKLPKVSNNAKVLLFLVLLICLRYLSIKFLFPKSLYEFHLFSPTIYADASSLWLNSLGDLFINTLLFFYITYTITQKIQSNNLWMKVPDNKKTLFTGIVFFIYLVGWRVASSVITGLIKHSKISFNINNIFSLNQYSYIALITVGLLLLLCFLFTDKLFRILKNNNLEFNKNLLAYSFGTASYFLFLIPFNKPDLASLIIPFALMLILFLMSIKDEIYSFTKIVVLVVLFSFYAEYIFEQYTNDKEIELRKVLAEKIAAEQDPVAEYLFNDIDNKLQSDSILISYISGFEKQPSEFEKRLRQIYFSGFWEKYDTKISFFDSLCNPIIKSTNLVYDNNLYFDELISKKGTITSNKHLFFLKNASGKISYLAKIAIYDSLHTYTRPGELYIELDAKINSNEIGFPELLLDKKLTPTDEYDNYSYAKYKNNKLIHQFGRFPYNNSDIDFHDGVNIFSVLNKDEFNHLLFHPTANTLIVVSKYNGGLYGHITTFSYLFTFFSLLLLVLFFCRQLMVGSLFNNLSFKYRIQLLFVNIVLISLILFGGVTVYYIKQQFKINNKENIGEKTRSVLMDIENKLGGEITLKSALSEYATFLLEKSSNVFFTDINLYDTQGNLFASSRPKIFDKGLISRKMNAEAHLQMQVLGKREFIHDEMIGKSEYLSAYIPFKNSNDKLLGYLNLPYFAKQNELEKEISGFLIALINIYVLLFVLSIIMAVIISNYVTQPLRLIQDKLSKINLGKFNEPIEWKEKDEIGSLVSEYNRMILELTKSAELLAKSERENAWREMAKQVAHEIKNPLTPMKLSIQHLQHLQNDGSPDMEQKIKQLTQTLIEQIDALSSIATEFSNFAKMPKSNLETVNLQDILSNSIDLFKDYFESTKITFDNSAIQPMVLADKEQLLRVFNNLIKNAIQAIPTNREGRIEIGLKQEDQFYLITIKDNGNGISTDNLENIFVPNFTTKTAGMGLGLAMVKNIIESINGKIWFETKIDKGTVFYVSLKCC